MGTTNSFVLGARLSVKDFFYPEFPDIPEKPR